MNTSTAVMNKRQEPRDRLDDFPTPPWATRALCAFLSAELPMFMFSSKTCREPAANRGHMVWPLEEYFETVLPSDIADYGYGYPVVDYLTTPMKKTDWVITNPPFNLSMSFVKKAIQESHHGCAFFVRTNWLESISRYKQLFSINPPSHVLQFSERVVLQKGKLSPKGSSATAYCWCIWAHGEPEATKTTQLHWTPPCRKSLETTEDYKGYQ